MNYRINDKGNIYTIEADTAYKHLKTLGVDTAIVTLHLNELGGYYDKDEDISIVAVNNGEF